MATSLDADDGYAIPVVNLHTLLDFAPPEGVDATPLLILEYLGKRLAISCDKIVGPREIVVNSLGTLLAGVRLYAGATISPSGKVQLILDTPVLVEMAYPELVDHAMRISATSAPAPSGLSQRVLVVDDSKATREAMRRMLEPAGYEVISAHDGKSAWNRLNEQGCDLLVTDLEMPGEGGFELLEKLRADPRHRQLPALVISSKDTAENRKRAAGLAAVDFITKPVTQEALIDALRSARRES
jgi:CheY-like chemotaxis protein